MLQRAEIEPEQFESGSKGTVRSNMALSSPSPRFETNHVSRHGFQLLPCDAPVPKANHHDTTTPPQTVIRYHVHSTPVLRTYLDIKAAGIRIDQSLSENAGLPPIPRKSPPDSICRLSPGLELAGVINNNATGVPVYYCN